MLPRNQRHELARRFSLIASARRHVLDPFVYLKDLLTRIPSAS